MRFAKEWFFDKDTCMHLYGPIHRVSGLDTYNYMHMQMTRGNPLGITW